MVTTTTTNNTQNQTSTSTNAVTLTEIATLPSTKREDDAHSAAILKLKKAMSKLAKPAQAAAKVVIKHRRESHALLTSWWVLSAHDEMKTLEARRGTDSWRVTLVKFFHRHRVQIFFIVLLILDVIIVFVELFIDAEFPRCHIIIRDATSCCDADSSAHLRMLASGSGSGAGHHALCEGYVESAVPADCDAHKHETVHTVHEALYISSVSILSAFAIELLLLLGALDLQFFHNLLYVIDFLVVYASLALEVSLHNLSTAGGELAGALVLARIWRFMRIAHGLATVTHEAQHVTHETHHEAHEEASHALGAVQEALAQLEDENRKLKDELDAYRTTTPS